VSPKDTNHLGEKAMNRWSKVALTAVCGCVVSNLAPRAFAEGIVTGLNGLSLSIYANPFDPDRNFNASESTANYGYDATGSSTNWLLGHAPSATHALDRIDGRQFYDTVTQPNSSSYIYNTSDNTGPAAFFQFTAPASFTVKTIITAQDINFSFFGNPQPYNLKFNTGSPGLDNSSWSLNSAVASGPGTVLTHPIAVFQDIPASITADTMRLTFTRSSVSVGSNSQAAMQEVILLPDGLRKIATSVTVGNGVGYSQDNTGGGGQGLIDAQGGPHSIPSASTGLWYDLSANPATNKFFIINVDENVPINAMVLFSDLSKATSPTDDSLEFDIFTDTNLLIGHVAFDRDYSEILPIKFDTPVTTSTLRFQVTNAPFYANGGSGSDQNIASFREVLLLTVPAPAGAPLLVLGAALIARRRRSA